MVWCQPRPHHLASALVALLLLPTLAIGGGAETSSDAPVVAAADGCATGAPPAWFLGVVHDDAQRFDFVLDIDNFEWFLDRLQEVYCIPDAQHEILAMDGAFERNGKTYPAASVQAVYQQLQTMGGAASAEPDATFFFFLSSHGLVYARHDCDFGPFRYAGSFAALDGGHLYDCELGDRLGAFVQPHVKQAIVVDCSFCGGFSDSLTAVSGTVRDNDLPRSSNVPGPNRVVITGCAMTTECFGGNDGGRMYGHLRDTWESGRSDPAQVSRWTAPGFPVVQGLDTPAPLQPRDTKTTLSELFFFTVWRTYVSTFDPVAVQQQYRIKYGMESLEDDIRVM